MTAEKAAKPTVRELFEKLAADEIQHQAYLKAVGRRYDVDGADAMRSPRRVFGGMWGRGPAGIPHHTGFLCVLCVLCGRTALSGFRG